MTPREYFEKEGKLYPCPNPKHKFEFWNIIGEWQIAEDKWSTLNDNGLLENHLIKVSSIETTDGLKVYNIVIWKLNILFGFV